MPPSRSIEEFTAGWRGMVMVTARAMNGSGDSDAPCWDLNWSLTAARRFMIAVMSTSTAAVSWAVDCSDSHIPLAMALRTRESGWVTWRSPPKSICVGEASGRSACDGADTACTGGGGVTWPPPALGCWAWPDGGRLDRRPRRHPRHRPRWHARRPRG